MSAPTAATTTATHAVRSTGGGSALPLTPPATRRPYSAADRAAVRALLVQLGWGRWEDLAAALPGPPRSVASLRGLASTLRHGCPAVAAAYVRRRETARPPTRVPWTPIDDKELIDAVMSVGWGRWGAVAAVLTKRRSRHALVTRVSVLKRRSAHLREAHRRYMAGER